MDVKIEESWKERLSGEFEKDYFRQLTGFVKEEYKRTTVYPPGPHIFEAFNACPFNQVKVVILGRIPITNPDRHTVCAFRFRMAPLTLRLWSISSRNLKRTWVFKDLPAVIC
jgi:Uracil-DNA glycosylase (EC 3.2.2.-)